MITLPIRYDSSLQSTMHISRIYGIVKAFPNLPVQMSIIPTNSSDLEVTSSWDPDSEQPVIEA